MPFSCSGSIMIPHLGEGRPFKISISRACFLWHFCRIILLLLYECRLFVQMALLIHFFFRNVSRLLWHKDKKTPLHVLHEAYTTLTGVLWMVFRIVNLNSKFHFNERKNQQMHETKIILSIKIITVFFFECRRGHGACLCYASNTGGRDHLFIHRTRKLTNC